MKKLSIILLFVIVTSIFSTNVLADGELYTFNIDEFEYSFSHGYISDEYSVSDNSMLTINGYNGSPFIDVNTWLNGIPDGLYVSEIMEVTELSPEYNWETHKDEYIEINKEYSKHSIYVYDSNIVIKVKAEKSNGESEFINFPDQNPILANDRTLLPIRAIAEYYGWNVEWNESTQSVLIENDSKKIEISIGSTLMKVIPVNGLIDGVTLDVPATIINGRTLLPIRAIAEAMDVSVNWEQSENCVILVK